MGVAFLVADQSRRIGISSSGSAADEIIGLSWCEHQFGGVAQRIDERANFGTWSAARSSDRLLAFFSCSGAMLMSAHDGHIVVMYSLCDRSPYFENAPDDAALCPLV